MPASSEHPPSAKSGAASPSPYANSCELPTGGRPARELYLRRLGEARRRCDRMMAGLMLVQWVAAVALALALSPAAGPGTIAPLRPDAWVSICGGALLLLSVGLLVRARPGTALTRHAVAVSQMLWSALLIHLSGGRIETHFHIFGSLAFLAFYRDERVLFTATAVAIADHLVRGMLAPASVYGIANPEGWRVLEHAFWFLFEDAVLIMAIRQVHREMFTQSAAQSRLESLHASVERTVEVRTRELAASRELFRSFLESIRMVPFEMDGKIEAISYVGPQCETLLGHEPGEWLAPDFWSSRLHPQDVEKTREMFLAAIADREERDFEVRLRHASGRWVHVRCLLRGLDHLGETRLRGVLVDVSRQHELEGELAQAQKLESVGRLASGVAHEINTPVQFVGDSVQFVRDAFGDLSRLMAQYALLGQRAAEHPHLAATVAEVRAAEEAADLEYVMEQVPRALERSLDGLGRVSTLVRSMKEFAHPDQRDKTPADLNHALSTTLTMARNEYKYVAEVDTRFGDLPQVHCHVGELNQVFLNIIVNAAHAIGDLVKGTPEKGRITVETRAEGDEAVIAISDTGGGIPPEIRQRIFEPFFTTKEVGKGTGQGLAIAHNVVVAKHGGTLSVDSRVGEGSTFTIRLPIRSPDPEALAEAA